MQCSSKSQCHSSEKPILKHFVSYENIKEPEYKSNLKQKEQCWKFHNTRLQIILQNHNNKKQQSTGTKSTTKTNGTR
jgi:hypothetical protein